MKLFSRYFLSLIFILNSSLAALPEYSYDPGPDRDTAMGRELIELQANMPNMAGVSQKIMGTQKFRPAFGPVTWRMLQKPNSVKILFIGQDATHIAEAAGRPATAGYGGRAQDLARYFGVNESAAFINTYAYTIKGQYGAFQTPYIYERGNKKEARFGQLVSNDLWAITQDLDSPIVKWRNDLISWIIRNNRDSLRLIVTFGGAARDAIATYIEGRNGKVAANNEYIMPYIQVPEIKLAYAGGNNEYPVPINKQGEDLYQVMRGSEIDYSDLGEQQNVVNDMKNNLSSYLEQMVFSAGGPAKNGLLHPAQLGGYNLDGININGQNTRSLKGLTLPDNTQITNDVLVVSLTHPTALSSMSKEEASSSIARGLEDIASYVENGWTIEADPGLSNRFAQGLPYTYSRSDIGPEYYDFGTPGTRMVPVSSASRMTGHNHVIIFGTRDRVNFDMNAIDSMTYAEPAEQINPANVFVTRPRTVPERYQFDPGPGEFYAKLMKENLNLKEIFKTKPGMSFNNDGIAAYNVKNHPDVADYGHYRGTFVNPQVVVLADPHGHDDMLTARALTGERGQYLQGMMNDLGIGDQSLFIKTVPFSMDDATEEEWNVVLEQTSKYRDELFSAILKNESIKLIIADGPYAAKELQRIQALTLFKIPVVNLERKSGDAAFGITQVAANPTLTELFPTATLSGARANIPRTHLTFYARCWEGTSGDRILNSRGIGHKGMAFAVVVPKWAFDQKWIVDEQDVPAIQLLVSKYQQNNLILGKKALQDFLGQLGPSVPLLPEAMGQ